LNQVSQTIWTGALADSLIAFVCVFGAGLLGMFLRTKFSDEWKTSDSKEVVRLVMGLVVTTVAMALGLLVGSAKNFYDTQNAEMAQIAADYIMLDRVLSGYGPEAAAARAELRAVLANRTARLDRLQAPNTTYLEMKSGARVGDVLIDKVQQLSPRNSDQVFLKQESIGLGIQLGQLRWLIYEQNTVPFPKLLLIVLIGWLMLLFGSFGIFAPRNPLVLAGLFASAAVVCSAILLILEMYNPQSGLIRVSDAPLRAAMDQLGR